MTEQDIKLHEAISAMVDGQLSGAELARTLELVHADDAAMATWRSYHLVGEAMRGGVAGDASRDQAFLQRLRVKLEPEVIAEPALALGTFTVDRPSANDARFRWGWVAGLAATVVAITAGWVSVPGTRQSDGTAVLARQPIQVPSAGYASSEGLPEALSRQQAMIRDPKLDQWLAAHRQYGGASALQVPAGFVRNATFEGAAR